MSGGPCSPGTGAISPQHQADLTRTSSGSSQALQGEEPGWHWRRRNRPFAAEMPATTLRADENTTSR